MPEPVRVFCDGCFDIFHFGHANVLRQAKAMGDILVAGVHSDEEISRHKRSPICEEKERYRLVRGLKWVDEVYEDLPYVGISEALKLCGCSFTVHGNDTPTGANGEDALADVKAKGMYRECDRTVGISTTHIIEKILQLNKLNDDNHCAPRTDNVSFTTLSLFAAFFQDGRKARIDQKIVYCHGVWDLFNVGHLAFLEKVAAHGTYVIVGVFSDALAEQLKGTGRPILDLTARALTLFSCKYVDDIVIGAPYDVTEELIDGYNIDLVCQSTKDKSKNYNDLMDKDDPFWVPKQSGKYLLVASESDVSSRTIINRVIAKKQSYTEMNAVSGDGHNMVNGKN